MKRPRAYLSLDVEDWEHANFSELVPHRDQIREQVRTLAFPMDRAVTKWIEICQKHQVRSTCFVLGEFARRFPQAIKNLARAGHEIATHGDSHDLVREMSRENFREFVRRSIHTIEDLTGMPIKGFRAPSWSVAPQPEGRWVYEVLAECGITYDSSVFPVATPLFGDRRAPLFPDRVSGVVRIPVGLLPGRLPFSTGAFFRLTPSWIQSWGLARCAELGQIPQVVLHPRELLSDHPRLPLVSWKRFVHYAALSRVQPRLDALLPHFSWGGLSELASSIPDALSG